jgi:subtilisin family serine protease
MAPKAEVYVEGMLTTAGATFESELVPQIDQALNKTPDIISLSAGTHTREDLPLMGFDVLWEERLSKLKGVMLIAAAGNNHRRDMFYPAAQQGVVGVGALDSTWRGRAHFSNFGHWVDVYAPGEYITNAFLTGKYVCKEPPDRPQPRHFDGMATWSGTSFATPMVAGLIAARMSMTGENCREAADALLQFARQHAVPGVGATLRPGDAWASLSNTIRGRYQLHLDGAVHLIDRPPA